MDEQILVIYCLCADLLTALHHQDDPQCRVSDAEVLTLALVGALYFGGNLSMPAAGYISRSTCPGCSVAVV